MVASPEYSPAKQAKIVLATCALHNFIRSHDPDDAEMLNSEEVERRSPRRQRDDFGGNISAAETERANTRRDTIAKEMWAQYQVYNAEH
jgi:hypothetical protein